MDIHRSLHLGVKEENVQAKGICVFPATSSDWFGRWNRLTLYRATRKGSNLFLWLGLFLCYSATEDWVNESVQPPISRALSIAFSIIAVYADTGAPSSVKHLNKKTSQIKDQMSCLLMTPLYRITYVFKLIFIFLNIK